MSRVDVGSAEGVGCGNDGGLLKLGIGAIGRQGRLQSGEGLGQSCVVNLGRHERFGQVETVRQEPQAGAPLQDVVEHLIDGEAEGGDDVRSRKDGGHSWP